MSCEGVCHSMPFFVHAGVPKISKVPVTTQDEDKSGKAMLYTVKKPLIR